MLNHICESSLNDLYNTAARAFPNTTRRQHATDPIEISNFRMTPFLGLRTLYIRARATNEDRHYDTAIVFKGVVYHPENDRSNLVSIATEGRKYILEQLSLNKSNVLVRCSCNDFHWRFKHFNKEDRSLQGPNRKPYVAIHNPGSANPMELEGVCKHLMKMMEVLSNSNLVK